MSDHVGAQSGLKRRRNLKVGKKIETFPRNESFLPDDVVVDILRRLPAKDVIRSRCVCMRWRDLSSTSDFIDIHMGCSSSLILKNSYLEKDYDGPNLLEGCWKPARTRSKVHKVHKPYGDIYLSHNGLIVAHGVSRGVDFLIYNPIYSDVVDISIKPYSGELCGVFFHPVQQEYCTLCQINQSLNPWKVKYTILNLESNPKWRDIKNPCTPNHKISRIGPVLIDEYLYWLVKPFQDNAIVKCDIVEYDIQKEEFTVIPCPAPIGMLDRTFYNVNLVDTDGDVSVVQVLPSKELTEINIWTLKDDGEQLWTSSNYIIINCDVCSKYGGPIALAFRDGELVVLSRRRLFVCNLKLGTFRKFGQNYRPNHSFLSHVISLASLKNCQPNICIAEEDESNHRDGSS